MGPDGGQWYVPLELAEVSESDVLGVTPPERSGRDRAAVDCTHTVRETVAALVWKRDLSLRYFVC